MFRSFRSPIVGYLIVIVCGCIVWFLMPFLVRLLTPVQSILIDQRISRDSGSIDAETGALSARIQELESENRSLRDQFSAGTSPQTMSMLPARIVGALALLPGQDVGTLVIDQGSTSGIKVGMGAIQGDRRLIGVITHVDDHRSRMHLLSHPDVRLPVRVAGTAILGVITGEGGAIMRLDGVTQTADISADAQIVTASSDQFPLIPQDLYVGKVVSVEKTPSALFQSAQIVGIEKDIRNPLVYILL